jgi:methylated-DNA-[protein]-cysteine S-methyltransferase
MNTSFATVQSPIGPLLLLKQGEALVGVYMQSHARGPRPDASWRADASRFDREATQVAEYFAGTRTRFDLTLRLAGTPFQRRVWEALTRIPYGHTVSYGALASAIGRPGASRAVGAANARNPLSIVVPCHRVVGADGTLTGYAGGPDRKGWLIDWERRSSLSAGAQTA